MKIGIVGVGAVGAATALSLIERGGVSRELVLVDGIKVLHADGWALVLPDPEEPLTHVWAEGGSEGGARALAQEYVGRIRAALVAEPER